MGVVNHVVKVRRRTVSVCDARIVANNVDVDTVTLDLDSEWGGLSTVVAFSDGDDQVMVSVGVEPVEIPRSLTTASGYLPVTVVGYGGDGLPRMVTAAAPHAMIIVNSGVVPDQSYPDAPDLIGQLVTAGDKANEAADNANDAAGNANAAVDRANELAGKLGDIDAQVTDARGSADAAANSATQAAVSASAAQTSERNAADSATAAAESKDAAKASETAAAQSAQTTTEQVSSIGDSVERAAASATAASQSASQAQSSATAANSSAQAAAASAESAQTATESAASSKDAAARSASEASESAQAAETSKTNAASSASAAKASETNAASSVSAVKVSETNAAASATAAQQAVDDFGLEVGTTTTGEPGTDAAVSIAKQGTKYVADFTIPRGEKGEQGASGINSVLTNTTLTGDGTSSSPLGISPGTFINPIRVSGDGADANLVERGKIYLVNRSWKNLPKALVNGYLFYGSDGGAANFQFLFAYTDGTGGVNAYIRQSWGGFINSSWHRLIKDSDLSKYVPLSTYQALETRVQALEAKLSNQ